MPAKKIQQPNKAVKAKLEFALGSFKYFLKNASIRQTCPKLSGLAVVFRIIGNLILMNASDQDPALQNKLRPNCRFRL